jgi:hypothetical protein
VQAVLGDSGGVSAEGFVSGRSAVAANDVYLANGMSDRGCEIVKDVVQMRIEMANVAGPMIAEEIIQLGERGGNVLVAMAIDNIEPLSGVGVVKTQEMILALFGGRLPNRHASRRGLRVTWRRQEQHCGRNPQAAWNSYKVIHLFLSILILIQVRALFIAPGQAVTFQARKLKSPLHIL